MFTTFLGSLVLQNSLKRRHTQYRRYNNYSEAYSENYACYDFVQKKRINNFRRKKVKVRKRSFIATLFATAILGAWAYYGCPYVFKKYVRPLILNPILNSPLEFQVDSIMHPTKGYLSNSCLLDDFLLVPKMDKTKEITDIQVMSEMTETKNKLITLFKKYQKLEPSVFVWEYSTGAGLEINSDKVFPSASIIKIPIAFELIRLVDETANTANPVSLTDKIIFSEDFRTSGSGKLQYNASVGNIYSLDYLASIMISDSDNTATNIVLHQIGGVDGFNRAMRNIGLKITSMGNWLPDLEGTNKITAREMSKILYNIDNPNYINPKYKNILKEYLGNTKNIHLIREKLPQDVLVLHKTGDIGTMLGDSGVVYTNNGKKYIVTILVKRPHNDRRAKTLIQEASLLIYNDIMKLK